MCVSVFRFTLRAFDVEWWAGPNVLVTCLCANRKVRMIRTLAQLA